MALIKGDNKNNTLKGGEGNDVILGFSGIDFLYGNAGNDWLNGGPGIDKLSGGTGNDTYVVDDPYDGIIERPDAGTDTIKSTVEWTLAANEENLVLTGTFALNGYGNSSNNTMTGNVAANTLYGYLGDDILDGRAGADTLNGGSGNDLLKIRDFNGDRIDGGSGGDVLEVYGSSQRIDLSGTGRLISNIEKINFSGAGHNVLALTPQSVLDLSSGTLTVDGDADDKLYLNVGGWIDGGNQNGYHVFTQQNAFVRVDLAISHIVVDKTPTYTVSNAVTAEKIGSFFTSDAEDIIIDFGGIKYQQTDLSGGVIDLSGFGLEDTLVIAVHDGAVGNQVTARYNHSIFLRNAYIEQAYGGGHTYHDDRVSWKTGASKAKLVSSTSAVGFGNVGSIQIIGLPAGLPDSQFVFV